MVQSGFLDCHKRGDKKSPEINLLIKLTNYVYIDMATESKLLAVWCMLAF